MQTCRFKSNIHFLKKQKATFKMAVKRGSTMDLFELYQRPSTRVQINDALTIKTNTLTDWKPQISLITPKERLSPLIIKINSCLWNSLTFHDAVTPDTEPHPL